MPSRDSDPTASRPAAGPAARSRRPPTAHDVARLAGVSQSAVSRSFTAGASVSPQTRERVQAAAKTLGYRPNLIARSLILRRSNIIGVAIPDLDNAFYPAVLEALSIQLAAAGYRLLLFTSRSGAAFDPVLEEVLDYRVDALILVSTSLSSRFADECRQVGLPVVLLNRTTADASASHHPRTNARAGVSSIAGENVDGARQLARFLIAGEHRRYAYIAGIESSSTNQERETAFVDTLVEHGLTLAARQVANYSFDMACDATRILLSAPNPPDALFCANDHMAIAAITTARAEFGRVVGKDLSIVGFDDMRLAALPEFGLTTYRQPIDEMVERAVSIINAQLQDPTAAPSQHIVRGDLIVRTSARLPHTASALRP